MYTYGYIRAATLAHLDLTEEESQASELKSRFYLFANEAMQAICASKPKYKYFKPTIVKEFDTLVVETSISGNQSLRKATTDELYYLEYGHWPNGSTTPAVIKADNENTKAYYNNLNIYLIKTEITMPDDFIVFANKKCFKFVNPIDYISEYELLNLDEALLTKEKIKVDIEKSDFNYISNSIIFNTTGEFWIPYRAIWFNFTSNLADKTTLDMPNDILFCIPIYIASVCLQIDYPQKAQIKRSEFEMALARCTATNFMELNDIKASFM